MASGIFKSRNEKSTSRARRTIVTSGSSSFSIHCHSSCGGCRWCGGGWGLWVSHICLFGDQWRWKFEMYFYQAPISDKSFVSKPAKKTFDHTKSGCDVTNNSFLHQWLPYWLASIVQCTGLGSSLACKPVSVWFGCSADKLDCVVLSVGALQSALFWYDATVSLLDDFQCCMILNLNFFVCIITLRIWLFY